MGQHRRQYERVTVGDRVAEDRARAFHRGADPPVTSDYLYARTSEVASSRTTGR